MKSVLSIGALKVPYFFSVMLLSHYNSKFILWKQLLILKITSITCSRMLEAAFHKPPATLKIVTVSRFWQVFYWFWSGSLKAASSILKRVTEAYLVAISGLLITFQVWSSEYQEIQITPANESSSIFGVSPSKRGCDCLLQSIIRINQSQCASFFHTGTLCHRSLQHTDQIQNHCGRHLWTLGEWWQCVVSLFSGGSWHPSRTSKHLSNQVNDNGGRLQRGTKSRGLLKWTYH